jgi:hypothetical protein
MRRPPNWRDSVTAYKPQRGRTARSVRGQRRSTEDAGCLGRLVRMRWNEGWYRLSLIPASLRMRRAGRISDLISACSAGSGPIRGFAESSTSRFHRYAPAARASGPQALPNTAADSGGLARGAVPRRRAGSRVRTFTNPLGFGRRFVAGLQPPPPQLRESGTFTYLSTSGRSAASFRTLAFFTSEGVAKREVAPLPY